jgi:hypothetical protein
MTTAENLQEVSSPCPSARGFGRVVCAAAFLLVLAIPGAAALGAEEPGPTLEAVRSAIAEGRTQQTEIRGFQLGKQNYLEVPGGGSLLIGFDCGVGKFMDIESVYALRPIYLTAQGEATGQDHGLFGGQRQVGKQVLRSLVLRTVSIRARPGYAVAAVNLRTGLNINGLSVTYMRISGGTLDPNFNYNSEWVGDRTGGSESTLGYTGAPVVGVVGSQDEQKVSALGLVLVNRPANAFQTTTIVLPKKGVVERPADVPRVIPPAAPLPVEPPAAPPQVDPTPAVPSVEPAPRIPETTPAPAPVDKKGLTTAQVARGMSWLPFAIFGVVTIPSFAVLWVIFGRKGHGLEGEPGGLSRPVKKVPRRPASRGTASRNRREKADPLSRPPDRVEDEAIPEVLPAAPEPALETRRDEPAPEPIVWDEDLVAEWQAELSFPPDDQCAFIPPDRPSAPHPRSD